MYGMFFTPCMVVFLHPMWYCPSGEIAVPLHPEKRTGITIDVAYRYFATPKRKFIVARHTTYPVGYQQDGPG